MKDVEERQIFVDIENTRNPEQRAWYQRILDEGVDPFEEEYFKKNLPHPILRENRSWMVTSNAVPYNNCKHHFLFVPKRFVKDLDDLATISWIDFHELITILGKDFKLDGYALFMRTGNTTKTGASVLRLHAHILVPNGDTDERTSIYPVVMEPEFYFGK